MVKIMKQNWFRRSIIPIILVLLFIYVYGGNIGKMTEAITTDGAQNVGEITDQTEIGQSFIAPMNNLSGFSIKLATYARSNNGDITLGIRNFGENKTIYSTTVKAESLADNVYYNLRFPPIKFSENKEYYIFVKSEGSTKKHSITAYMSNKDIYKEGSILVNGIKKPGDLAFKVFFNRTLF